MPRGFAALPALTLIIWGVSNAVLMKLGWKHNSWMDGVIPGKISVAYPKEGSNEGGLRPGVNGPGAVMILGAKSNSPLGMFEEGYKEIADRFKAMVEELEEDKETNGCKCPLPIKSSSDSPVAVMGMSTWIAAGERSASNELATFSYWRSTEDIHNFALSPTHRDAWRWWNATVQKHNMLGIMHEIFEIPKKSGFEGVYLNYAPTGLAATTKPVHRGGMSKGEREWVNPVVEAERGQWRSSRGRMAKGDEDGSSNDEVLEGFEAV